MALRVMVYISGMLMVRSALDREKDKEHFVVVKARDGGGLECVMKVHIVLTDVNDNAPSFSHPQQITNVLENTPVGTLVTRIQAFDLDSGMENFHL